VVIFVTHEPL